MVSGGVPLHRGGCGGGGGGPCVRFEAIELLFSDFAGCQFDFAKDGNLVLTFHGYTGTVTLKSAESDKQASPLCGSEAGSLGVLADADTVDDVSMDNVDYDIALSQLEQGDSPKSSPPTILSHPQRQEHQDEESPAGMLFHSPTAMRDACEGKQDELPTKSTTTTIASAPSTTEVRRKKSEGDALEAGGMLLANLVSPSSSVKTSNPSCFANAPSSSHTAPPSPPPSATQGSNKRPAASSLPSSGGHSGGVKKAVSPDSFSPTTSPPSATGCSAASRSKPKRARRARDQEQPQPFLSNSSSKGSAFSSSSPAGAAAASSKNGCRGARRRPSVEVIEESATDDDVGDCQDGCGGLLGEEDGEGERGGAGSPAVVGVPVESAAAAWIASARRSAALPSSPGPLSRSARASEIVGDSVGDGGAAPMGRWGHSATMVTGSRMLVLGGQADDDAHQATLGDMYKFDFATETWSRPMNCDSVPRAWHTASFVEGKNLLVIFGGERTVDGCPECLDDIMVLDTDIDLLYPPAISGKSPTARSGHSASIVGTDLIVFGGVRGRKWQNNVAVLDTERWHWRHPTIDGSNPAPRSYHSATVVGRLMVIFGGNNQDESFDRVHVLDTSKSRWVWSCPEVVGAAPAARTGHSAVLLPDGYTILIHGGWDPEDEGGVKNFGDAYLLDTRLWEWSRGPEALLGAETTGLRVGHTTLLARSDEGQGLGRDGEDGGELEAGWKAAYFGGQDGGGVRRSELSLVSL